MPRWEPTEEWKGQDVFVIGGGPSLKDFDWSLLNPELTIGCNTAFIHGPKICKICIFGDPVWYRAYHSELKAYSDQGGIVVTNANPNKLNFPHKNIGSSWLWTMRRKTVGLDKYSLGWNSNTGSSAINLALILGAKRVYLLGFDMKRIDNKPNWHDRVIRPAAVRSGVYSMFAQMYRRVVRDWKKLFPDREIFNITKDSALDKNLFPWIDPDVFWKGRKVIKQEDLRVRQLFIEDVNQQSLEAGMYQNAGE